MSTKSEKASAVFATGFGCAASVIQAFCEDYDLETQTAAKLACGFGGGCATGEICGAASGAIMVVGLRHGQSRTGDQEAKSNCHNHVVEFIDRFKKENNALTCRDLLGCDMNTEEGRAVYLVKRETLCPALVKSSASILAELGY